MDARAILWDDTAIYLRRYEKAATALIAVQQVLRSRRPLRGEEDEFLDLCGSAVSADPEHFTQLWRDPSAYFWVRRAYELLGSCLNPASRTPELEKYCSAIGSAKPQEALALHLEEFKKLIIGLKMISGGERRFRRPMETKLPFSIPGSRYSVTGCGSVRATGIDRRMLEVVYNGESIHLEIGNRPAGADAPRIAECPMAWRGAYELLLKPEAFYLPGIGAADVLHDVPDCFQEQQVALLEEALELIERHQPFAYEHLCEVVRVIALKPPASGQYSNVSYSDLPGAFILSAFQEPYWIADALIHELFHNRLFFIQEVEPILIEPDGAETANFYSPWRDDLRPLNGLLHALYVYIQVVRFWSCVWRSGETGGQRKAYVADQAVRGTLGVAIAASQLRRHGRFTKVGAELFAELESEAETAVSAMSALGLSSAVPAMIARPDGEIVLSGIGPHGRPLTVIDTMRQHARRHDVHRQCSDLEAILRTEGGLPEATLD